MMIRRNLAAPESDIWPEATYDAVFCRNVIMYFTPEVQQAGVRSDGVADEAVATPEVVRAASEGFEVATPVAEPGPLAQ